jgi:hypothetical protein
MNVIAISVPSVLRGRSSRALSLASVVLVATLLCAAPAHSSVGVVWNLNRVQPANLWSVASRADGSAVAVGLTDDGAPLHDAVIAEIDAFGTFVRARRLASTVDLELHAVASARDGGYVAAGNEDQRASAWIVKLGTTGGIEWQERLAVGFQATFNSVVETPDGIVAVGEAAGGPWACKFGDDGSVLWDLAFGSGPGHFESALARADGSVVALGRAGSNTSSGDDVFVVELSSAGVPVRQSFFDAGSSADDGRGIAALPDGTFVICGNVGWTNRIFAAGLDSSWHLTWTHAWNATGILRGFVARPDGTVVGFGEFEARAVLSELDAQGSEVAQVGFGPTWWLGGCLEPDGSVLCVGASQYAVIPNDWSTMEPCTSPYPTYGPASVTITEIVASIPSRALAPIPVPTTATFTDATGAPSVLCPDAPIEPMPIRVRKSLPEVVIWFPPPANGRNYAIYEGPIGSFRPPALERCAVAPGDPGVAIQPDGTIEITHLPVNEDAWFLLSSSNAAGESRMGAGSDGPIDVPPSAWRCGPHP